MTVERGEGGLPGHDKRHKRGSAYVKDETGQQRSLEAAADQSEQGSVRSLTETLNTHYLVRIKGQSDQQRVRRHW